MPDYDVWEDFDEIWTSVPEPKATFTATTPQKAALMASESGEFDYFFENGYDKKLIVREVGTDSYWQFTLEPRVSWHVSDTHRTTLAYFKGESPT